MQVITLTSDLGMSDFYLPALKGYLHQQVPSTSIIDITHQIKKFQIEDAAYILKNAFLFFPEGTIHIIGVKSINSANHDALLIEYKKHFFLGIDNGMFSILLDEVPTKMYKLNFTKKIDTINFFMKDALAAVAINLVNGKKPEQMGVPITGFKELLRFEPTTSEETIRGIVTYIDEYENVITNINKTLFDEIGKGRKFEIFLKTRDFGSIERIAHSYSDVRPGELIAIFNLSKNLEIAINLGNAASLLYLKRGDVITIEFY
jgi:S-adenosyl-L-methionine hydrolase (adenosine-forming)